MVPTLLLERLYTVGSLQTTSGGVRFAIKNRLADAELVGFHSITIDGGALPLERIRLQLAAGRMVMATEVNENEPIPFPLGSTVTIHASQPAAPGTRHDIEIHCSSRPYGALTIKVEDTVSAGDTDHIHIPRSEVDDYDRDAIGRRRELIEGRNGAHLQHLVHYSFDPHITKGNCENFVGVAQVPIGLAGPLLVHGEHAQGEYLIPLATTEGTLVASHNRGMKVLNLCGGVKATVVADAMQRAPVFVLADARACRDFVGWVQTHFEEIRRQAEATSSVAKLQYIDPYVASKFAYLRFNFTTGDAAGQNMVGRATWEACNWIRAHYEGIGNFYLESNLATDKKASHINILRTRGKRVTAEATIARDVLMRHLRVEPEVLQYHYGVANVGAFLSGANNNGAQSPNSIAAIFIATGQDVANVAESSAAVLYSELTPSGDLYLSLTIPSLIVATYGGGTGLATQRECLEILDCSGRGKVNRLAEIIAGVALAGEISLGAAISSADWVSAHERHGRNR
jgi:hydroxymethylglutaryl-CoA reductase (NADPH)